MSRQQPNHHTTAFVEVDLAELDDLAWPSVPRFAVKHPPQQGQGYDHIYPAVADAGTGDRSGWDRQNGITIVSQAPRHRDIAAVPRATTVPDLFDHLRDE